MGCKTAACLASLRSLQAVVKPHPHSQCWALHPEYQNLFPHASTNPAAPKFIRVYVNRKQNFCLGCTPVSIATALGFWVLVKLCKSKRHTIQRWQVWQGVVLPSDQGCSFWNFFLEEKENVLRVSAALSQNHVLIVKFCSCDRA